MNESGGTDIANAGIIAMIKTGLFAAAGLLVLSLCAPAALAQDTQADADGAPGCIWVRNINGYSVLDAQHVVLNGGASRHYLVTTTTRCSGLRFGVQLATSFGDTEHLCPPFVEYIIPEDGWRCAIDTIEEVESLEHARDLVAARSAEEEREDSNRD